MILNINSAWRKHMKEKKFPGFLSEIRIASLLSFKYVLNLFCWIKLKTVTLGRCLTLFPISLIVTVKDLKYSVNTFTRYPPISWLAVSDKIYSHIVTVLNDSLLISLTQNHLWLIEITIVSTSFHHEAWTLCILSRRLIVYATACPNAFKNH